MDRDVAEAARLWQLAAAQGSAQAQNNLGVLYDHGCAVELNKCEALRLYRLSAAQNYAEGQYNLGVTYAQGCVVPQDLNEAARLYRAAAAQHLRIAEKALRCLGYDS